MLNQSSPELYIWEILPSSFSDQLLWVHINYLLHLYLTLVVQLCPKIHPFLLVSQFKVIQILKAHLSDSLNFLSFCWYCSLFISNFINIGLFSFFCLILLGIVNFFKGSIHGLIFLIFLISTSLISSGSSVQGIVCSFPFSRTPSTSLSYLFEIFQIFFDVGIQCYKLSLRRTTFIVYPRFWYRRDIIIKLLVCYVSNVLVCVNSAIDFALRPGFMPQILACFIDTFFQFQAFSIQPS